MPHDPAKYEELRKGFLQAAADFDDLRFRLRIEHTALVENELLATGHYDDPCYTEWPYGQSRTCAVLAPCDGDAVAPYSRLKLLAASAWLGLPEDLAEALLVPAHENEWASWRHHYQGWLWLLWADSCHEEHGQNEPGRGPAGVDMDPFTWSASLIEDWGLNRNPPTPPEWVAQYLATPAVQTPPDDETRGGALATGDRGSHKKRPAKGRGGCKPHPEIARRNKQIIAAFKRGATHNEIQQRFHISAHLSRRIKSDAGLGRQAKPKDGLAGDGKDEDAQS